MVAQSRARRVIFAGLLTMFAGTAAAGTAHNLQALHEGADYDGFIVKYRQGSAEDKDPAALSAAVSAVLERLKKSKAVDVSTQANPGKAFGIGHARRLAMGSHLIRASRKLSKLEGLAILREIAAERGVGGAQSAHAPGLASQ